MIGIKNGFWRFVLALILTLLTIGLFQLWFDASTVPDTEGFFTSLGNSLKGMQYEGFTPPDFANSFFSPTYTTTPSVPILPSVEPPKPAATAPSAQPKPQDEATLTQLGKVFGVAKGETETIDQYRARVQQEGQKGKTKGREEYYVEETDGKLVLKRYKRYWFDETVPPDKYSSLATETQLAAPPASTTTPPASPSAPAAPPAKSPQAAKDIQKPAQDDKKPSRSLGTWIIAILIAAGLGSAIGLSIRKLRKGRPRDKDEMFDQTGAFNPMTKTEKISYHLGKVKKEKESKIAEIKKLQHDKKSLLQLGENKEKLLEQMTGASAANLYTDEGRKAIKGEKPILHDLLEQEENVRWRLRELHKIENELLKSLTASTNLISIEHLTRLQQLMRPEAASVDQKAKGIIALAAYCDAYEKQDEAATKELERLMEEGKINELVHGKFKTVEADWDKLEKYNAHEDRIIALLEEKVKEQNEILSAIISQISQSGDYQKPRQSLENLPKAA